MPSPIFRILERCLRGLNAVEGSPAGGIPVTGRSVDKAFILNQAWRRSDWRFLTARPWPQRSLVFGDDQLARSLALISGSLAVNRPAPEGSCDLAAIQNPTDGALFMAMQALAPSGCLYVEFANLGRNPLRVARAWQMLEAAGFADTQFFIAYPSYETARLWLPYARPAAPCRYLVSRWFSKHRVLPAPWLAPVRALVQAAAARLLETAIRLDLLPGLCAVARKPSGRPGDEGQSGLLDLARKAFERPSRPAGAVYPVLLHSTSLQPAGAETRAGEDGQAGVSSTISGLVFAPGEGAPADSEPQWALKMARVHAGEAALRSEQQILERLERVTSVDSSPVRLPRVLFLKETDPGVVLCQTAPRGRPLSELLGPANFSLYAERLTNLQISLARRTLATSPQGLAQTKIEGLVSELAGSLPEAPLRPAETARLRQVFSTLVNLPLLCAHHQYAPWNVYIDGSRLGLINWTDAEWSGLPMLDLVYMLAQMTFILHHARGPEQAAGAYHAMLDPLTRPGQVAQECLFRYTHSLGLPSGLIPALRLLTWTLQTVFEYRHLSQAYQAQVPAGRMARSEPLALLRVELQEQVLPAWEEEA